MKMHKMIPLLILLFTGYLCNKMDVAANTTSSSHSFLPAPKATQNPELERKLDEANHLPARHLTTVVVAGISNAILLLLVLIIIGVWCAWKKSKVAEVNSIPSGEPGVCLKRISVRENQREQPFERALQ